MGITIDNIQKITKGPKQTLELLLKLIKLGGMKQSFYLEGPSGIGKSELVQQLAEDIGAELIDIRLGAYDTIDMNGIGIPDIENKKALWTRPEFYPDENCEKKYILFLDEFNMANEQMMGLAYQLVLERRVNTHKLPKNLLVIGAGNRIDDKGISFALPSPLVNRFLKINVVQNINDFIEYGQRKKLNWKILGFLKANPEYLHKFDGKSSEDNFPTPRNWFHLDVYQSEFEDKEFIEVVLNGLLGFTVMTQFTEYLKLVNKIPQIENILKGNFSFRTLPDLNSSYAFYMLAINYVKNNIDNLSANQFINLIKYNSLKEFQSNKEVMETLNLELIQLMNKHMNDEVKQKIQFLLFENKEILENNKSFINKFSQFTASMKN